MQWDDHILEENNVLVSERHSESRNDGGKDVQKFSSTVELVRLMNQSVKALIDGLANHFASWYKLEIKEQIC